MPFANIYPTFIYIIRVGYLHINFFVQLTRSKGEAINSLLQLAGRLQLVTAQVRDINYLVGLFHYFPFTSIYFYCAQQIDKAADNKSQSFQPLHQTDESEDEEVEEFLYGEEDEESQSSSDNEDQGSFIEGKT